LRRLVALLLLCSACGPEFDRPSELRSLRVLAVKKDQPYTAPGQTINMSMLWHDGSPGADPAAPRTVQRTWLSFCFNPPADQYYGCFGALGGLGAGSDGMAAAPLPLNLADGERICAEGEGVEPNSYCVGSGDTFSFTMPESIISARPAPIDPTQPAYGLSFVFFAACAGELQLMSGGRGESFPLVCLGSNGERLGADDFVAGYSAVYAYDEFRNTNPAIDGFQVAGVDVEPGCIDEQCLGAPVLRGAECAEGAPTIPSCERDGSDVCPEHQIRPLVDPAVVELDAVTASTRDRRMTEQMWINYYVDRGSVKSDVRLLNDAVSGFNSDYGTEYRAPKQAGPATVWAVVHDNRGGVSWARTDVCIIDAE
jgi:hypothetical protein